MSGFTSMSGARLYHLLPAVYRERDNGDLAAYLDACGSLLDAIQQTLDQRLADNFPDTPPAGLACQEWLLPYFGKLLDVRLVSPLAEGRRAEIARAVAWRQAKGTLAVIEQIAEAVGGMEVEIAEGWQRVATMARIGMPLLPAVNFGVTPEPDRRIPSEAARHPALPNGTVDVRYASRAVTHRAACLGGHDWVQGNPHGVPCVAWGFDDASRRTVDLRTPGWSQGHHHPRTLLLFAPPPAGFFPAGTVNIRWSDRGKSQYRHLIAIEETPGRYLIRNRGAASIRFTGPVTLDGHMEYAIEGFSFSATINCVHGRLILRDVAAPKVMAQRHGPATPALTARNCLFRDVTTASGLMRLEYCTVLRKTICEWLEASDCLFIGKVQQDHPSQPPPQDGCVRFSRLPVLSLGAVRVHQCTGEAPVFFSAEYGQQSCAVLHPASGQALCHGAEDGGEVGCYHDRHYVLLALAVVDKLKEYLPVGLEAVLVHDPQLACPVPKAK